MSGVRGVRRVRGVVQRVEWGGGRAGGDVLKQTEQNMMTAMRITMSSTMSCTLKFCHHILFRSVRPVL